MDSYSKSVKKLVLSLTFASLLVSNAETFAANPSPVQYVTKSTWTSLKKALPKRPNGVTYALAAGSYRGEGRVSKTTYLMHLVPYFNQQHSFIAVVENLKNKRAMLGFLKQQSSGVYFWYGIRASQPATPGSDDNQLEIGMDVSPLAKFSLRYEDNKPYSIESSSLDVLANVEAVDYEEARAPLMNMNLMPGRYSSKDGAVSITGNEDSEGAIDSWTMQIDGTSESGASFTQSHFVRQELPGAFAVRAIGISGYAPEVSGNITKVVVSVTVKKRITFWESTKTKVIVFPVSDNFLGNPKHYYLND